MSALSNVLSSPESMRSFLVDTALTISFPDDETLVEALPLMGEDYRTWCLKIIDAQVKAVKEEEEWGDAWPAWLPLDVASWPAHQGPRVRVVGLTNTPQHNGCIGRVAKRPKAGDDRVPVHLDPPENTVPLSHVLELKATHREDADPAMREACARMLEQEPVKLSVKLDNLVPVCALETCDKNSPVTGSVADFICPCGCA